MVQYSDVEPRTNGYAYGAMMPSKTKRQQRTMAAAAAGKSRIGIPPAVGKEYMAADRKMGNGLAHRVARNMCKPAKPRR